MTGDWLRLNHGGLSWRIHPEAADKIRSRDWEAPVADGNGLRIVQQRGSRVSALWEGAGADGGDWFVKWYGLRHPAEALKYWFRPSRLEAEWRRNGELAAAGLPVAECLAFGERRSGGWWTGGVLIQRAVTPPLTLAAFLAGGAAPAAGRVADLAADLVARFHARGYRHHDLHGENVLVVQREGRPVGLLLADLHETTRSRIPADRSRTDDLARLNAYTPGGARLRMRFWLRYAATLGLTRERRREWFCEIDRESRAIWKRHFGKRGTHIERY